MKSLKEYSTSYIDTDLKTEETRRHENKSAVGIPKHDILGLILITVAASERKRSAELHEKTVSKT